MKKKILMFLSLTLCIFILTSCFSVSKEPKNFSSNGLNITLTEQFKETEYEGYTAVFESRDTAVFALKEGFEILEGSEKYTIEEYGKMVLNSNTQAAGAELKTKDGLISFEYDFKNTQQGVTFRYFTYLFKTNDAFWIVQFAIDARKLDSYTDLIPTWAKSISFE